MSIQQIRIATRSSPLALWQANYVAAQLQAYWPSIIIELVPLITSGDRFLKDKLLTKGGKGLFVKELEDALLDNRADIAVHSMKDVPAMLPQGLSLPVICKRDNPFDVLVSPFSTLDSLPLGSTIGTSSLRRQSQLLAYRNDLNIKTLRGNINTRLAKLDSGEYDAIILAAAGLERMGLAQSITEHLSSELMLPACGQGALGIECRTSDQSIHDLIHPLNDSLTAICVSIERRVNEQLGGNCHVPLAVYCNPEKQSRVTLQSKVLSADGQKSIIDHRTGPISEAVALADASAAYLFAHGAEQLLCIK